MALNGIPVVVLVDKWMDGDGWKHGGPTGGRHGWTAEQRWDGRKHDDAAGGKSGAGYGYGRQNCWALLVVLDGDTVVLLDGIYMDRYG